MESAADAINVRRPLGTDETVLFTVADKHLDGDGAVAVLLLEPSQGEAPAWEPGAHVDVVLAPGLERQYSLCGGTDAGDPWRIGVLREPVSRGGSEFIHSSLAVGDMVSVRGPRNNFRLVDAPAYTFIAGGIGVTPLIPMIREVERRGAPWTLTYGGRSATSMAFIEELSAYGARVTLWPQDEKGFIPLADIVEGAPSASAVYCCGPEPLLNAIEDVMSTRGADRLHLERFRPRQDLLQQERTAFEVYLDYSEMEVQVEAHETIVEALERVGVEVITSCREGTCGTCETVVLEGVPDHRDSYLSTEEKASNEVMMVCCSRARTTRLVLDL